MPQHGEELRHVHGLGGMFSGTHQADEHVHLRIERRRGGLGGSLGLVLLTGGFGRGLLAAVGGVLGFFGGGRFGSLGFRTFFLGGDVDEGTTGDEQGDFGAGRGRDSQGDGQGQHTAQQGGTWQ